jgi:hypothetical protein
VHGNNFIKINSFVGVRNGAPYTEREFNKNLPKGVDGMFSYLKNSCRYGIIETWN